MTTLYAEFLPNIRTLTITTALSAPRNSSTSLWLSSDHSKLILEHDDETRRIILPAKVPGQGSQHLQLPSTGETQCINRIPAEADTRSDEVFIPWSAGALSPDTEMRCKSCDAVVSGRKVHEWKDLPSESWAEMMDLWHCHKPAEPEQPGDDPTKKGYAAGNRLVAKSGTGFVDVMNFLLAEEDCTGVQVSLHLHPSYPVVYSSGLKKERSVASRLPNERSLRYKDPIIRPGVRSRKKTLSSR